MKQAIILEKTVELGISIEVYDNISVCADEWNDFMTDHLFMSTPFLKSIERCPPRGLIPFYVLFRNQKDQIVGKAYFQNKTFKGSESLKITKENTCPSFFSSLGYYLKQATSKKVEFESLSCGHIMLSGEYAFRFEKTMSPRQQHQLIDCAIHRLINVLQDRDKEVSIVLLKDFPEESRFSQKTGLGPSFFEFQIQPSMILKIRDEWNTEDDYLQDLTSKYRTRYRRARKKLNGINKRELDLDEVIKRKDSLFDLYKHIANNSGFNLFHLHADYLMALKEELGEKAKITGYFHNNELIGFTTMILDERVVEAHFIGLDDSYNRSHQLYQNMLYDMAVEAIEQGAEKLDYARTALEIKSTVGAEPRELYCYMRHQKGVHNTFVPKLFKFLNPQEKWVQRRPFKD